MNMPRNEMVSSLQGFPVELIVFDVKEMEIWAIPGF